jgi:hypothetical protein
MRSASAMPAALSSSVAPSSIGRSTLPSGLMDIPSKPFEPGRFGVAPASVLLEGLRTPGVGTGASRSLPRLSKWRT